MRVLVVHNRYSSRVPSGENLAVDDEVRWLGDAGVEVHRLEVSNDDVIDAAPLARAHQAVASIWSLDARRRVEAAIDETRPDVVHVHNLFPLLTASVPSAAARRGVPVVWTVHNTRLDCVAGTHFRAGAPCHLCRPGWRLPGVRHACYADSLPASGLVTVATSIFGRVARRRVTALAISESMRRWLVDTAGFSSAQVRVKYNAVAAPATAPVAPPEDSTRFLFAGHLADHKGMTLLLEAWQAAQLPRAAELHVLGDGPRAADVRAAAADDHRITWHGQVAADAVREHIAGARVVVVPALWDEPFGRIAAEALACGRPVITTGSGGLSEIVNDQVGWLTGRDPQTLAHALETAAASDSAVRERGEAATRRHRELFSPVATTRALIQVYEDEVDRRSSTGSSRSSSG